MTRGKWKSKVGFMWAAIGSAVGLGSIWRFPYVVGENGGGAFVVVFIICLFLISFPVLLAEVVVGRKTQLSPSGAFQSLTGSKAWKHMGGITILTGFLVSSFYGVICAMTLGYLVEAILGKLIHFTSSAQSATYFSALTSSPIWSIGFHALFFALAIWILYFGVQKGIENKNKFLMPLLFVLLLGLVIKALTMQGMKEGLAFLFTPNWSSITPSVIVMALGQAFFGVSLGQGTMVTYGSYLSKKEHLVKTCYPIVLSVIVVSLLAGMAIFPIVFSVGIEPSSGPNLMFKTLPLVFSTIPGGYFLSILFFLLIFLAGLTSQISALEPVIAYLIDAKHFSRRKAVLISGIASFLVGIPSALSFGVWDHVVLLRMNFFDFISSLSVNLLVPIGGLAAVILVGWKWGIHHALNHVEEGAFQIFHRHPILKRYLTFSIKYFAPIAIVIILCNLFGLI